MQKLNIYTLMEDYFKFVRGIDKFENTYWGKDYTRIMTAAFLCRIFFYGLTIFNIIKGYTTSAVIDFIISIFLVWLNVISFADSYIRLLKKELEKENETNS